MSGGVCGKPAFPIVDTCHPKAPRCLGTLELFLLWSLVLKTLKKLLMRPGLASQPTPAQGRGDGTGAGHGRGEGGARAGPGSDTLLFAQLRFPLELSECCRRCWDPGSRVTLVGVGM